MFRRVDGEIETRTEIVVSPEDDAELRRVSITNHSLRTRNIELTSYAEVVLAPGDADLAHPAFSNLFVETPRVPERDALICARRPRSGRRAAVPGPRAERPGPRRRRRAQYETDRARFIGRGGTLARPDALFVRRQAVEHDRAGARSDRQPAADDPAAAGRARRAWRSRPDTRTPKPARMRLIEKYHDRRAVARALALAGTHGQIELRHLGLTVDDTHPLPAAGRPACSTAIRGCARPKRSSEPARPVGALEVRHLRRPADRCWRASPDDADLGAVPRAAAGARVPAASRGSRSIWSCSTSKRSSYRQELQDTLQQMLDSSPERAWIDGHGGVFLRRADSMPPEDQMLLRRGRARRDGRRARQPRAAAGPPADRSCQIHRTTMSRARRGRPRASGRTRPATAAPTTRASRAFNGLGGFADGWPRVRHPRRTAATARCRRRRGRTSSRSRRSGSRHPSSGPATRGRRTATTTG